MKAFTLLSAILICATLSLLGQGAGDYIKWKTSVEQDDKGNATLVVKATVHKEWNGYSIIPAAPDEGPLPTEFKFEPTKNYSIAGKMSEIGMKKVFDEMFGLDVMKFSPTATFKQPIKVTSEEDFVIKATISFMICKDLSGCIPGETSIDFFVSGIKAGATQNIEVNTDVHSSIESTETPSIPASTEDLIEWEYVLQQADKSGRYQLFLYPHVLDGWKMAIQPLDEIFFTKEELGVRFGPFQLNEEVKKANGFWENANFQTSVVYSGDEEPAIRLNVKTILNNGEISKLDESVVVINFSKAKLLTDGVCEPKIFDGTAAKDKFSYWELMIEAFLWGIASLLTPCVFPMIPMTVSFFMKDSNDPEAKKSGKKQALFYGFSIIGIYTLIGTIVAITLGAAFANWLATHWFPNVLFFLVFMFFAASFLGMFEIRLPSWMINKADQKADKGGVVGTFFMALTLVLVSFSCTGPIVGIILIKASQGAVIEPMLGMFAFSLAFALPFTLFAIFPAWLKNLPQSGGWLNTVKVVLGFIEIALGLKFLSVADQTYHWGLLDREVYISLWIVIFSLLAMYLLGKLKFSHDSDLPYIKVPRLFFAMSILAFVVYLVPGLWGHPLKALSGYLPPMSTHDFDILGEIRGTDEYLCGEEPMYGDMLHLPHGIAGYYDFQQAVACARSQDKPLFIDFTGHGCVNCREMEAKVWSDPAILKMLKEKFVVVALYADDKTILPEDKWVKSRVDGKMKKTIGDINLDFQICNFGESAQPLYATLDKDGNLLQAPISYTDKEEFKTFLEGSLVEFKKSKRGESPI